MNLQLTHNRRPASSTGIRMTLLVVVLSLLVACSPAEQLEQLQVEFPEPEKMILDVQSDQRSYQLAMPSALLDSPEQLEQALEPLPEELHGEVLAMLEQVEPPPPAPIPGKMSRSVKALDALLKSLGQDLTELQQDLAKNSDEYQRQLEQNMGELSEEAEALAEQAEQHTSEFLGKMKQQYVNHIATMIANGELSPEQIDKIEQAIAAHQQEQQ